MQLAREKDTGTLRYELFFNADKTECVVHEDYVLGSCGVASRAKKSVSCGVP